MGKHSNNLLTALQVSKAKAKGRYRDGGGLYLVVRSETQKHWILRAVLRGKRRDFSIGSANKLPLATARAIAVKYSEQIALGIDPLETKRASKASEKCIPTFEALARDIHAQTIAKEGRNEKYRNDWLNSLVMYAFPELGARPVNQITLTDVANALRPIWVEKAETARRVKGRIQRVLDVAAVRQHRPTIHLSALKSDLGKQGRKVEHFASMAYADIPAFVANLNASTDTTGRKALLFLIATAARSGEVRLADWSEIDLGARRWTIPAERMKAGAEHIVQLNDVAMSILTRLHAESNDKGLIFAGTKSKPLSDMTLTKILRDAGLTVTAHGFRSTFRDWAAEKMPHVPDPVAEAALAHKVSDAVIKAYKRTVFLDMRRDLMAGWSNYMLELPAEPNSTISPIRQADAG